MAMQANCRRLFDWVNSWNGKSIFWLCALSAVAAVNLVWLASSCNSTLLSSENCASDRIANAHVLQPRSDSISNHFVSAPGNIAASKSKLKKDISDARTRQRQMKKAQTQFTRRQNELERARANYLRTRSIQSKGFMLEKNADVADQELEHASIALREARELLEQFRNADAQPKNDDVGMQSINDIPTL